VDKAILVGNVLVHSEQDTLSPISLCSSFLWAASPYTSLLQRLQNFGPLLNFFPHFERRSVFGRNRPFILSFIYFMDLLLVLTFGSKAVSRLSPSLDDASSVFTSLSKSTKLVVSLSIGTLLSSL